MPEVRSDITWRGQPFLYPRAAGHGLVIGRFLYLLDEEGKLDALHPLTSPLLNSLLKIEGKDERSAAYAQAAQAKSKYNDRRQNENG